MTPACTFRTLAGTPRPATGGATTIRTGAAQSREWDALTVRASRGSIPDEGVQLDAREREG
ncbi:hypothetical protein HETIRDRAFT_411053 [Heterobasidion irregulare TC 32-1]|uniref:Uncharacterized protein n=1 Tax=Heterobasidion irregulare (strain TC 32-1) TaxID=747525 RepID=W4JVT9_HETIT|nr:uncharacterized protein HETIRDRAFT_411053 [Heterobasidion irregulare TC 32-1]ETW77662.1 hypothetical protein HETIRDRAFT_411053 [Heterobasidion irregulare TC 32-1]